jgi:hypothetical protein
MATFTSKATGNWSASGQTTWNEAGVPGDGDIATIGNGHVVTVDVNTTVGSNSSSVGKAITISGSSSSSFGKLIVADGVTLTLKGNDGTTNAAMYINRYGQFEPAPGATIHVECASKYETLIVNLGIINSIGTALKPITFTGQKNWNNDAASETKSGSSYDYAPGSNISVRKTTYPRISNAAGTGLGSFGDSSLVISNQNPATIATTEVATLAAVDVDTEGEYWGWFVRSDGSGKRATHPVGKQLLIEFVDGPV